MCTDVGDGRGCGSEMQNLQLEMLRQFTLQQQDMAEMMEEVTSRCARLPTMHVPAVVCVCVCVCVCACQGAVHNLNVYRSTSHYISYKCVSGHHIMCDQPMWSMWAMTTVCDQPMWSMWAVAALPGM